MPELISNSLGFTPDPIYATINKAGVAYSKGDVVAVRQNSTYSGPGLNYADAPATTDTRSEVYAVVLEDRATTDDTVRVCLRGMVDAKIIAATGITLANSALVSTVYDASAASDDALTSSADADTAAANPKVLALFVGRNGAPTGTEVDLVLFDGLNGLGSITV